MRWYLLAFGPQVDILLFSAGRLPFAVSQPLPIPSFVLHWLSQVHYQISLPFSPKVHFLKFVLPRAFEYHFALLVLLQFFSSIVRLLVFVHLLLHKHHSAIWISRTKILYGEIFCSLYLKAIIYTLFIP